MVFFRGLTALAYLCLPLVEVFKQSGLLFHQDIRPAELPDHLVEFPVNSEEFPSGLATEVGVTAGLVIEHSPFTVRLQAGQCCSPEEA